MKCIVTDWHTMYHSLYALDVHNAEDNDERYNVIVNLGAAERIIGEWFCNPPIGVSQLACENPYPVPLHVPDWLLHPEFLQD